jgi:hypothetical protein
MGLYKGQKIITGSYMLHRVDDNRQVNVSRKRMHKKREEQEKKKMKEKRENTQQTEKRKSRECERYLSKKHKFTPSSTRGLVTFDEEEYIA